MPWEQEIKIQLLLWWVGQGGGEWGGRVQQLLRRLRTACAAQIWRGDAEGTADVVPLEQGRPGCCKVEHSRSFLGCVK